MTGLPYNIQAGSAFVDEEDPEKRMLFNEGGIVDKVTKALGVSKQDLDWAKSLDKKFPEAEQLDGRGDAARHLALGWLAKSLTILKLLSLLLTQESLLSLILKVVQWTSKIITRGLILMLVPVRKLKEKL